ncbi:acyl-CoA dehydrogenase [Nocardioides sp. Root1257]|uniref:acyl-CoA dehydrogenase family protein n=1 Tax=unclassified Nocardioides TaxID=2615069 RepID=UPI0006FD1D12|nr:MULTISPECIES: acyl-CoA dehydrogenase family protein [unclassified Nocardioides]KQW53031.1 acyl-CoA dehydrogenase [Nocardioides sp. Root1257]KRC55719.1 acyl-CoA dehydrogenase [Nocardioides sp. Root224]
MKFEHDGDEKDFAAALDALLSNADTVAVARAWADGDHEPGVKLWGRLAEMGVTSLADEPVFLVLAFERLGYHAVPGPYVESIAYLARDEGIATVAVPPHVPYALDADVADVPYVGPMRVSVDRTRRLFEVETPSPTDRTAFDRAVLAVSAQLLGAGERVLADSVTYVKQRKQFGREIGSYQAIKHALADVRIALDFARPLVHGAALGAVDVSAAKVAAGDAAYLASRTGLQVHGAIGYTQEFDLSLWLTKIRALVTAWGTPDFHRARILQQLGAS